MIAAVIVAASAGTAVAAVITGGNTDNTLIGTPSADTISDGNGNDTIYALGGADVISDGNGNDQIDGDGKCQSSSPTSKPYCSHDHDDTPGQPGDTISAGNGNDTVFGGGGNNTISVGRGVDTIYGSPTSNDTISAGMGSNQGSAAIFLGTGKNTVSVGGGTNRIYAFQLVDLNKDTISCASSNSVAYVNSQDITLNCTRHVGAPPAGAARRGRSRHHTSHKTKRHRMTF